MIRAGDLRHRITLYKTQKTSDGAGGYTETNQEYCSVWAKAYQLSGKEIFRYQQIFPSATYMFVVRHNSTTKNITEEMAVIYNNKRFNILNVEDENEEHRFVKLLCERAE